MDFNKQAILLKSMFLTYVKIEHDYDTEFFEIDNNLNILALLGIIDEG